jgi:hypothetical protein
MSAQERCERHSVYLDECEKNSCHRLSAPAALLQPAQSGAVLRLDLTQRLAADLPFGHKDQIETQDRVCLVPTKAFTKQPLRLIALYRSAYAPARGQPKAPDRQLVLGREQGE